MELGWPLPRPPARTTPPQHTTGSSAEAGVADAALTRDLYVDFVNHTAKASATLLQLAGQIAQDAVRPLQERAHARA